MVVLSPTSIDFHGCFTILSFVSVFWHSWSAHTQKRMARVRRCFVVPLLRLSHLSPSSRIPQAPVHVRHQRWKWHVEVLAAPFVFRQESVRESHCSHWVGYCLAIGSLYAPHCSRVCPSYPQWYEPLNSRIGGLDGFPVFGFTGHLLVPVSLNDEVEAANPLELEVPPQH